MTTNIPVDVAPLEASLRGLVNAFSQAPSASPELLTVVDAFCQSHANTLVFSQWLPAAEKSPLLTSLVSLLSTQASPPSGGASEPDDQLLFKLLNALRLLLREADGVSSILNLETASILARIIGLCPSPDHPKSDSSSTTTTSSSSSSTTTPSSSSTPPQSSSPPCSSTATHPPSLLASPFSHDTQTEAVKALFNLLTHSDKDLLKRLFSAFRVLDGLLALLALPSSSPDMQLTLLRILARACAVTKLREAMLTLPVLQALAEQLRRGWERVHDSSSHAHTLSVMRLLVSVTLPLGPLNITPRLPTDEEFEVYRQLVELFQSFLFLPREGDLFDALRAQTVSCLINVPARCTDLFQPERTLEALIYVLGVQVAVAEKTDDAPSALISSLLVLTSIAKAIPRARRILRGALFPPEVDVPGALTQDGVNIPVQVRESGCLAGKLIPHMCALNSALKQYASELLYEVCDEDHEELIRLTGFGFSAGLLATHGLIDPSKVQNVQTRHYDPEEPGQSELPEHPPQELLDLMQRLEERGLLKVVTKDGTPFDYDACAPDPTP